MDSRNAHPLGGFGRQGIQRFRSIGKDIQQGTVQCRGIQSYLGQTFGQMQIPHDAAVACTEERCEFVQQGGDIVW